MMASLIAMLPDFLTTYETVVNCQRDLAGHPWEATVWDEAHKLKNPKAKVTESAQRVACPSRFALTGTRLAENCRDQPRLAETRRG